jgi:exodeoxyribonuclease VII small subunit
VSATPKGPAPGRATASLQADLERLEQIVRSLEQEDLDLDRALALFEEGVARLRDARTRLGDAELRLKQLREAADGSVDAADLG